MAEQDSETIPTICSKDKAEKPQPPKQQLSDIIKFNVSGELCYTRRLTLQNFPDTPLAKAFAPDSSMPWGPMIGDAYFIDRPSRLVKRVLETYQTLILPWEVKVCDRDLIKEFDYWGFETPHRSKEQENIRCHAQKIALSIMGNTFGRFIIPYFPSLDTVFKTLDYWTEDDSKEVENIQSGVYMYNNIRGHEYPLATIILAIIAQDIPNEQVTYVDRIPNIGRQTVTMTPDLKRKIKEFLTSLEFFFGLSAKNEALYDETCRQIERIHYENGNNVEATWTFVTPSSHEGPLWSLFEMSNLLPKYTEYFFSEDNLCGKIGNGIDSFLLPNHAPESRILRDYKRPQITIRHRYSHKRIPHI